MRVRIRYSDGEFSMIAAGDESVGSDIVYVHDAVWRAYLVHCDQHTTWNEFMCKLSNEAFAQREAAGEL